MVLVVFFFLLVEFGRARRRSLYWLLVATEDCGFGVFFESFFDCFGEVSKVSYLVVGNMWPILNWFCLFGVQVWFLGFISRVLVIMFIHFIGRFIYNYYFLCFVTACFWCFFY